ncbi:MAG: LacI family DNA-binding transcriptional regulator [Victivallaceae bacterium]
MKKQITIRQIAVMAGVNASTVSRVFNANCGHSISDNIRNKVLSIAEQHEYVPKGSARSLAHGKSFNLGIVLHDIESDLASPFLSLVLSGFCRAAMRGGYQAVVLPVEGGDCDQEVVRQIRGGNADAYLVGATMMGSETVRELGKKQIPVVTYVADKVLDELLPNVCYFKVDNAPAFEDMLRTVKDRGFDRYALFCNKAHRVNSRLNLNNQAFGIEQSEIIEFEGSIRDVSVCNTARLAANKAIQRIMRHKLIVCSNDLIALGLCEALREAGIRPGKDISVIGYDNIEQNPNFIWPLSQDKPFLATIDAHEKDIGTMMAEQLLTMLNEKKFPSGLIEVPAKFIQRDSLGMA